MGGQVYDRESIEKMYGKGGENFPGETALVGSPQSFYGKSMNAGYTCMLQSQSLCIDMCLLECILGSHASFHSHAGGGFWGLCNHTVGLCLLGAALHA